MKIIPTIKEELDWQIYFRKNNDCTNAENPSAFIWTETGEPVTLRSAYPHLKEILEKGEKAKNKPKSPLVAEKAGHRKQMFSEAQKMEIYKKYAYNNTSIKALAREYKCSPKTIRNVINYMRTSEPKKEN